jgi:hypothetical protein
MTKSVTLSSPEQALASLSEALSKPNCSLKQVDRRLQLPNSKRTLGGPEISISHGPISEPPAQGARYFSVQQHFPCKYLKIQFVQPILLYL